MVSEQPLPSELNTEMPHPARVYDYWLGGEDNFPADRELGDLMVRSDPGILHSVRANRAFLKRAVRYLVREAGLRQFLDLGSGLPSPGSVHEVALSLDPGCRVVYVDNDPMVCGHGRTLLEDVPSAAVRLVRGDARYPAAILGDPAVTRVLDLHRPVAVLCSAVLHYLGEQEDPAALTARFAEAVAPGSHLLISHLSGELLPPGQSEAPKGTARLVPYPFTYRPRTEILACFNGLELVDPGLVRISEWRPDGRVPREQQEAALYGGIGVKR